MFVCNIVDYTRLDIWSIGRTLQTGLVNIWRIWTGWTLLNYCKVRQCEFSPAMCMKCEAFYRKPHIVSFTHNVKFSVKGLSFHTHCWRKLALPYLVIVQQSPTSPNRPDIDQTWLNCLKRPTNTPYV